MLKSIINIDPARGAVTGHRHRGSHPSGFRRPGLPGDFATICLTPF